MRRLSYILIAITLGFTPNQSNALDSIYSVAGDVSSPRSYRYSGTQQVHLRDLLNKAGYNNAAGIARILRGTPLRTVTTDSVDPKMAGSGSLLFPGDVVVFRSFDGHCPGKQNALAMLNGGPALLELPGRGYPVWRLLEAVQMPRDGRISVARTRHGSASEVWMSGHEFIQHGDIIDLGVISQTAGLRISQVHQSTAGFGTEPASGIQLAQYQPGGDQPTAQSATANGERQLFIHENGQPMPSNRSQHLPDTTVPQIQMVQYSNDSTAPPAFSDGRAKKPTLLKKFFNSFKSQKRSNEDIECVPQVWAETSSPPSVPPPSLPPPPPPIIFEDDSTVPPLTPVDEHRGSSETTDSETAVPPTSAFSVPSIDSEPVIDNITPNEFLPPADTGQMLLRTDSDVQTKDVAADGPFRMASLQTASQVPASPKIAVGQKEASNKAWNVLFLTGLTVAAGLIVFGWLKTKKEQAAIHQYDGGLHDSRIAAADDGTKTAVTERLAVPAASQQNSQTREQAVELSTPPVDFAVSTISGDCPVLSAGIDDYETTGAASPSVAGETVSADNIVESHKNGAVDSVDSKGSPQWLSESRDGASDERGTEVDAVATAKNISPGSEAFGDLEDLIQNRLPVDMKQADLPLRIALFGKPAGPRRLRIDAAHTQTAPPHIMTSARQEQKSKPTATTAPVSHHDRASYQPDDVTATNADHERFDHALDFLEGQSDS